MLLLYNDLNIFNAVHSHYLYEESFHFFNGTVVFANYVQCFYVPYRYPTAIPRVFVGWLPGRPRGLFELCHHYRMWISGTRDQILLALFTIIMYKRYSQVYLMWWFLGAFLILMLLTSLFLTSILISSVLQSCWLTSGGLLFLLVIR